MLPEVVRVVVLGLDALVETLERFVPGVRATLLLVERVDPERVTVAVVGLAVAAVRVEAVVREALAVPDVRVLAAFVGRALAVLVAPEGAAVID